MGSGSWDTRSFVSYSTSKGYGTDSRGGENHLVSGIPAIEFAT